ncbi:methyltransferase domain-containing protein [Streptomyces sp. NBC_00117]|uniref:class I SAM-dependent methyltransferase n=1 Tax=Streptomyces sp. NBC_00117 TaxID=2975657 RepID=UPI00324563CD
MSSTLIPFIREFVKAPTVAASVIPSSKALARQVASPIPSTGHPVVVELGPGTGAFTRTIQERLDGRGQHIALDVNERFTALLTERFPAVDALIADARDLPALLTERGLSQADAIVSGLPWASFRPERQRELLDAVVHALSPRGAFTTFAYIHALPDTLPRQPSASTVETDTSPALLGRTFQPDGSGFSAGEDSGLPDELMALQRASDREQQALHELNGYEERRQQRRVWFEAAHAAQAAISQYASAHGRNRFEVQCAVRTAIGGMGSEPSASGDRP